MAEVRSIRTIAIEITKDWNQPYSGAVPYLTAMLSLQSIQDHYGADDAEGIVLYFLSNAGRWRGETARRVKKELNEMVKKNRS